MALGYQSIICGKWISIERGFLGFHLSERGIAFSWADYFHESSYFRKIPGNLQHKPDIYVRFMREKDVAGHKSYSDPEYYDGVNIYDCRGKIKPDKRRKIGYIHGKIQLLKPEEDNGHGLAWHGHGKHIGEVKAAYDLIMRGFPYEIVEIDSYVRERVLDRARKRGEDITFKLEQIIE
ncbi:MAG: hypothetical protein KKE50_03490 [Nanoarchaeota archaeon]|nr:hypothetical protein [Nanoarchaeota archaeon]